MGRGPLDSCSCGSLSQLVASSFVVIFTAIDKIRTCFDFSKIFSGHQLRQLVKRQVKFPRTFSVLVIRGLTESHMSVRASELRYSCPNVAGPVTGGETKGLSGPTCSLWSSLSFMYLLVKGPGLAQYETTISVKIVLVYICFSCFLYNAVHVSHVLILSCH